MNGGDFMAKKKAKSAVKELYEKNKEKIMAYLADFLEQGGKSLLEWVKRVSKIKERIRKVVVSTGFILAGLIVLLLGISDYLATLTPDLPAGVMHIIVGVVTIVLAMVYVKV